MSTEGNGRRERLAAGRLYLVTGVGSSENSFEDFLTAVLEAGVDIVQLREKTMEAAELLHWAAIVRRCTHEAGALFVVNDRADLAMAAGADGLHLGQADLPLGVARTQVGSEMLLGLSTHSVLQLDRGMDSDADYCAVGPVFATPTKPGRSAVGLDLVEASATRRGKPVFAIGGINPSNVASVIAAGASRVAVVRALTEARDPAAAARRLLEALPSNP